MFLIYCKNNDRKNTEHKNSVQVSMFYSFHFKSKIFVKQKNFAKGHFFV